MAAKHRGVIGQQLQRYNGQHRLQKLRYVRDGNQMVGKLFNVFIALGRNNNSFSAASPDLFDVAHNFVVLGPLCGNKDRRHIVND